MRLRLDGEHVNLGGKILNCFIFFNHTGAGYRKFLVSVSIIVAYRKSCALEVSSAVTLSFFQFYSFCCDLIILPDLFPFLKFIAPPSPRLRQIYISSEIKNSPKKDR